MAYIDDVIEVLLEPNEKVEIQTFLDKVQEIHTKNKYGRYEAFELVLETDKTKSALVLKGSRPETAEETTKREVADKAKQKRIEEAELKEYLRLKSKYAKKDE